MRLNQHNTSRLFLASGPFGEIQIVAGGEHIIIDLQARNYDATGHLHHDHAMVDLSLSAAIRLKDLLDEAITHAYSVTLDTRQTALWSPATHTARGSAAR